METAWRSMATTRDWIALAVLALPSLLVSIDVSVMLLALPKISASLGADAAQQLWIMDIYSFMLAGVLITMGTLGDRIGRRKLLLVGAAAFGLASALAAFAPNAPLLILARAALGVAGATLSPSILALITNMFRDERQRGIAIAIWFSCFMGGMTIGPLVGGVVLDHFWWGAVFLIGVPPMLLLLVAGPFLLPEYRDENAGRLDLISVVLSLAGILLAVYGVKELAKGDMGIVTCGTMIIGVALLGLFIGRQRSLASPLLDLRLFTNRPFATMVAGMFLVTATGAFMLFTNEYFQLIAGLDPLPAGLCSVPGVLTAVIGFNLAPRLAQRYGAGPLICTGIAVAIAGLAFVLATLPMLGIWSLVIGFCLFNGGCAPMVTLSTGIVVGTVRPEKAGAAAVLQETCSQLGFSVGIAALGSLAGFVYRLAVTPNLPDLPLPTAEAARQSLAGALAVAASLGDREQTLLIRAATEAFVRALTAVVWVEIGIFLAVILMVVIGLRMLRPVPVRTVEQG